MDRASASYPHGAKGPGFTSLWRKKLYNCNLYYMLKYRLYMVKKKELSLKETTLKKKEKKEEKKSNCVTKRTNLFFSEWETSPGDGERVLGPWTCQLQDRDEKRYWFGLYSVLICRGIWIPNEFGIRMVKLCLIIESKLQRKLINGLHRFEQ